MVGGEGDGKELYREALGMSLGGWERFCLGEGYSGRGYSLKKGLGLEMGKCFLVCSGDGLRTNGIWGREAGGGRL